MKIIHLVNTDLKGGAARAAFRLHTNLIEKNIDSMMCVGYKFSNDLNVIGPKNFFNKIFERIRPKIESYFNKIFGINTTLPFSLGFFRNKRLLKKINKLNPDIIHIHWIGGGFFSVKDIYKLKAKIVWSLHDNWAFTGGCHIKIKCNNYMNSCKKCPYFDYYPNITNKSYQIKSKYYSKIQNLKIIGLSKWINNTSKSSNLLKSYEHVNIPNPVNINLFKPSNISKSYLELNLDPKKKYISFGAMNAINDINKGFKILIEAFNKINYSDADFEVIVFGNSNENIKTYFSKKIKFLGNIDDDKLLSKIYSISDLLVVPSMQENLSNVIIECMSCNTPVVAFDVGGNSDIIVHKQNGYLAKPYFTKDLKDGIIWTLKNSNKLKNSKKCITTIRERFDQKIITPKYIKFYKNFLNEN